MSEDFVSPMPTGSDPESVFHQETHARTRGPASRIRNTTTVWVEYTPRGIFLHAKSGKGGTAAASSPITRYTLVNAFGDYLVVRDSNGSLIPVARVDELRCSVVTLTIEGVVYNYTYPGTGALLYMRRSSNGVIEGITPPYLYDQTPAHQRGSQIYAFAPSNGTGATIQAGDETLYGASQKKKDAGTPIDLVEMTQRAWTVLSQQTGQGA